MSYNKIMVLVLQFVMSYNYFLLYLKTYKNYKVRQKVCHKKIYKNMVHKNYKALFILAPPHSLIQVRILNYKN